MVSTSDFGVRGMVMGWNTSMGDVLVLKFIQYDHYNYVTQFCSCLMKNFIVYGFLNVWIRKMAAILHCLFVVFIDFIGY